MFESAAVLVMAAWVAGGLAAVGAQADVGLAGAPLPTVS